MKSGRRGIWAAEGRRRRRLAEDRLERMAAVDPPVVAAVEQPDVGHAGVAEDERRAGRGDLAGPPARPLLVGVADRVAAVQDDRRVGGDPEREEGRLDHGGGAAVPVRGVLETIGIEVQGAGEVVLLVLLGDPEVDVEEEVARAVVGVGRPPSMSSRSHSV